MTLREYDTAQSGAVGADLTVIDSLTGEIIAEGEKSGWTDDEWESYIRAADPAEAIKAKARRIYEFATECPKCRGGSHFSAFMSDRFGYSKATSSSWKTLGDKLFSNAELFERLPIADDWSAYYQIATSPPELLDHLADEGGVVDRKRVNAAKRQLRRDDLAGKANALPDGKHRVIYADPPWKYGDERTGLEGYSESAAAAQYPTMPTSEICALDVKSLAADDSVLFLWATFPLLPDAIDVVNAWGFTYKTAFVWDKQRANMGNYHDARAELLIVATRGSCTPDVASRPPQVQAYPRGRHSAKPEEFRSVIDGMYEHGPRVELFRRGSAPDGWKVWGNEAE